VQNPIIPLVPGAKQVSTIKSQFPCIPFKIVTFSTTQYMNRPLLCSGLLLILLSSACFAQSYHSSALTISNGLPSNRVNSVTQDALGQLWISTNKGVSIYDGINWKHFSDSIPMPINTGTRLKALPSGRVIILGQAKNFDFIGKLFQNNSWVDLPLPDQSEQDQRRLWAAEEINSLLSLKLVIADTLYTYQEPSGTWSHKIIPKSLGFINKAKMFSGTTYLLTSKGVFVETQNGFKSTLTDSKGLAITNVIDLIVTDTSTYVLGSTYIGESLNGIVKKFPVAFADSELRLNELHLSRNGYLFFRSDLKFYWFHPATGNYVAFRCDSDDALPLYARLFIDREDNLWLTSYRGLHKINSFNFLGFNANNGLQEYEISSIAEIESKKYFVGGQRGYAIIDDNRVILSSPFTKSKSSVNSRTLGITTVEKNNQRTIYITGQELGLGILQPDYKIKWINPPEREVIGVNFLQDTLWVIARPGSLYYFKDGKFTSYSPPLKAYSRSIYMLDSGEKVLCTAEGLRIISKDHVSTITTQNDLLLKNVYCLFKHNDQYLLGTDAGLAQWKDNTIMPARLNGVSITNPVYAVIKVSENEFWFGTDKGVYVIQGSEKTHYSDFNGLLGIDVNRGAFIQGSDGTILIGTNRGLNIFDPNMKSRDTQIFPPEITSIETTRNNTLTPSDLALSNLNHSVKINFRSISFTDKPVEFRYRMNNFETTWMTITSEDIRYVLYRNLPPGEYTFELQSKVGNSPWSARVKTEPIYIKGPLYSQWWFIIIIISLAIGAGYMINKIIHQFSSNKKLKELINDKILEVEINESKLQLALENARMGVWTYTFRNNLIEYSRQFFESLGIALPRTNRLNDYKDYVHSQDLVSIQKTLREAIQNRHSFDIELRFLSGDIYKWTQVKGKCIYDHNNVPTKLSGTILDINERKQIEADREKLIEELEQTNRELDRFVYSASHDLSAPMKSVMGLINLAKLNPSSEELQQYLSLIDKSVRKQDEFIREIIAFSRNSRTEVSLENVDFKEVLDETLNNLKYTDQYNRSTFSISLPEESSYIMCDRVRLKIILNNILSNAIKFQRKGESKHTVHIDLEKNHRSWKIKIGDNGEGIKSEHLPKMFSMFYRATDSTPGSGLGLYIAKEAAEKMGCHIDLQSEYGRGSTFTLIKNNLDL
jgi:signal transduction histidine kinase/ligand-binding sensor domain-containing protein